MLNTFKNYYHVLNLKKLFHFQVGAESIQAFVLVKD